MESISYSDNKLRGICDNGMINNRMNKTLEVFPFNIHVIFKGYHTEIIY